MTVEKSCLLMQTGNLQTGNLWVLRNAMNVVWMLHPVKVDYMPSLIPRTKAIIAMVLCPDPPRTLVF